MGGFNPDTAWKSGKEIDAPTDFFPVVDARQYRITFKLHFFFQKGNTQTVRQ